MTSAEGSMRSIFASALRTKQVWKWSTKEPLAVGSSRARSINSLAFEDESEVSDGRLMVALVAEVHCRACEKERTVGTGIDDHSRVIGGRSVGSQLDARSETGMSR